MIARWGPFYNVFGYGTTWEWGDVWSESQVNERMRYIDQSTPWEEMVTNHDVSTEAMDWSQRQDQTRDVFDGNSRTDGKHGGVDDPSKPVVGSEDIWEISDGNFGSPRNREEVRRGGWGEMMAGVLPLYSEMTKWMDDANWGDGEGEDDIRRMFDFFYKRTRYREYEMLNDLVSSDDGQICSGIPGKEYLVYDQEVDAVTIDLSGASGDTSFEVVWFDPIQGTTSREGSVDGGEEVTLDAPIDSNDGVLLLTDELADDRSSPTPPTQFSATATGPERVELGWRAARDPETGIDHYDVYRDGTKVGEASDTGYEDGELSGGTTYEYEVRAVNGAGREGGAAGPISATTDPAANPGSDTDPGSSEDTGPGSPDDTRPGGGTGGGTDAAANEGSGTDDGGGSGGCGCRAGGVPPAPIGILLVVAILLGFRLRSYRG
jgi:MYXO-CTERM domain-containing protein